jgi:SAM-dependent methyltransferase
MRPRIFTRLVGLPRLDRKNALAHAVPCKICGGLAPFFDVVDFQKSTGFYAFGPSGVTVPYHRCDGCGFLFTTFFDDWNHDEFARFIYNNDYVAIDPDYTSLRPRNTAHLLSELLSDYRHARVLDYGAGSGVFASVMEELGHANVVSYDPFTAPRRPTEKFDIAVCIEVIEHSPQPTVFMEDVLSFLRPDACLLLGESLQPNDIDRIRGNWWYIAPRNGHVSTFSDRTLVTLARRYGLVFHRGGRFPHAFCRGTSKEFAALADRVGPALECFRLGAPGRSPVEGFNGIEGIPGDQFQWTATDSVIWQTALPPGSRRIVQVMIPFAHQFRAGFAEECKIEIGGTLRPVSVHESAMFAESGPFDPGELTIVLRTPETKVVPGDGRRIGLAVRVAAEGQAK